MLTEIMVGVYWIPLPEATEANVGNNIDVDAKGLHSIAQLYATVQFGSSMVGI